MFIFVVFRTTANQLRLRFAGKKNLFQPVPPYQHARTYLTTKILRDKVDENPTLSTATGCLGNIPTMLDQATFCRTRCVPYEPFHAVVMGNSGQLLTLVSALLSTEAFIKMNSRLEGLERPCNWSMPVPRIVINVKDTKVKMSGQDVKHVIQVLHVVCFGWLTLDHLTKKFRDVFKVHQIVIEDVLSAIEMQAQMNCLVFAEEHPDGPESGVALQETMQLCLDAADKVWGKLEILNICTMNRHAPVAHYKETHEDFGGLCNCSGARCETKHACLRRANRNSNNHFPEVAMVEKENVR